MKPLIIFGFGKIADVVYNHISRDKEYEVVAFTCDAEWLPQSSETNRRHLGYPVFPFEDLDKYFPPESVSMFVAIGYHDLNLLRATKCKEVKAKGYTLINYVSPRVDCGPWLDIGENCLILDGVGIQPGVKIGNNVSIWNNVLIGHHSTVQDHCWIAAGATLGGLVSIGDRCFVGLNATIGGELSVGPESFLGAATLVTKDVPPKSVFIAASTQKYRLDSDDFMRITRMPAIGVNPRYRP
jgi:sugar O-acyltransferase (sialic acid O-acetyltransferase NeuD family)